MRGRHSNIDRKKDMPFIPIVRLLPAVDADGEVHEGGEARDDGQEREAAADKELHVLDHCKLSVCVCVCVRVCV